MRCEICGESSTDGYRVRVEGGIVNACQGCSRYGEVLGLVKAREEKKAAVPAAKPRPVEFKIESSTELVDDYAEVVRKRRSKMGLKQEELAKKVNEPASLIQKIESGRMRPSPSVGRKLQKVLSARLYTKVEDLEDDFSGEGGGGSSALTLGDLVVVKKKTT